MLDIGIGWDIKDNSLWICNVYSLHTLSVNTGTGMQKCTEKIWQFCKDKKKRRHNFRFNGIEIQYVVGILAKNILKKGL